MTLTSTGALNRCKNDGESFPKPTPDNDYGQRVLPVASYGDEHDPLLDMAYSDEYDIWYDCRSKCASFYSVSTSNISEEVNNGDSVGYARDRQIFDSTVEASDDVWHDCVLGHDDTRGPDMMISATVGNGQRAKNLTGHTQSTSTSSGDSHIRTVRTSDPFYNRDRFLNMTDRTLPDQLVNMLNKDPNFALSRSVNRHVLKEVELGLERGAFALRWKERIDRSKSHSDSRQSCLDDPTNSDVTPSGRAGPGGAPGPSAGPGGSSGPGESAGSGESVGPGESAETEDTQDTQQDKVTVKLAPRFSDTDTRAAPTAEAGTEKALKVLKQKVMTIYRNHKPHSQPNHQTNDVRVLKDLSKDPAVIIKRSDKCKGLVVLPKSDYVLKAGKITAEYESISKNPTPRLEAETKRLIKSTMVGKVPDKIVKSIIPSGSRTAELYGLPKTHKPSVPSALSSRLVEIPSIMQG